MATAFYFVVGCLREVALAARNGNASVTVENFVIVNCSVAIYTFVTAYVFVTVSVFAAVSTVVTVNTTAIVKYSVNNSYSTTIKISVVTYYLAISSLFHALIHTTVSYWIDGHPVTSSLSFSI